MREKISERGFIAVSHEELRELGKERERSATKECKKLTCVLLHSFSRRRKKNEAKRTKMKGENGNIHAHIHTGKAGEH